MAQHPKEPLRALSEQEERELKRLAKATSEWLDVVGRATALVAVANRLARRLGKQKAVMAVAHSLLVIIYHMLRDKQSYRDLGATFFETRQKERVVKGALRRLESFGYIVTLHPQEEVSP